MIEQLLQGSAEINRLHAEIRQICSLIVGFLNRTTHRNIEFYLRFVAPAEGKFLGSTPWWLGKTHHGEFYFMYRNLHPGKLVYPVDLKLNEIAAVHADLPGLVESVLQVAPWLVEEWQPLLMAATKNS